MFMKVVNYSEFRTRLRKHIKAVTADRDVLIVARKKGRNVVIMDMEEYNSIQETLHLTKTAANHIRLVEAIAEMNAGSK